MLCNVLTLPGRAFGSAFGPAGTAGRLGRSGVAGVDPGALLGGCGGTRQVEGGVDQRDMGEGLREVADLTAVLGVVFLGQQPEVVAQRQQTIEQRPALVTPADLSIRFQP